MGQIYQPRDPSVAYQASQSLSNPGPQQAIDNSSKIAELGRQAGNYLGNYSQQALREQEFQSNALSRANEVNLQNTRNSIAAFQAAQQGDLAKAELMGRADLNNLALQNESQARTDRLALGSSELNSQLQLRNAAYLSNSVTDLGKALVGFSGTLWNKRVEQIDKENEALRVQGVIDRLNGKAGNIQADIAKINAVETGRVIESGKANAAADSFEAAGRPNEATLIRSNNPFYLQGVQEATAMKASLGYMTFLTNSVEDALKNARIQQTGPGAQQQLIAEVDKASKEYILQNGLDQINPGILAKYFGYEKAQAEAAIVARYNNQNNKAVKDIQVETAKSLAFNNYQVISKLPIGQQQPEILKLVATASYAEGGNQVEGRKLVLAQFQKAAEDANDMSLVDRLMTMDDGTGRGQVFGQTPGFQEAYVTFKRLFEQKQGAQLSKFQDDQLKSFVANYKLAFATGDPDQIRAAQQTAVSSLLKVGTPEAKLAAAEILNDNAGDAPAIKQALEYADDKGFLNKQYLDANRSKMTKADYDMWSKRLDQTSKLKTDPAFKTVLDSMEMKIMGAAAASNINQSTTIGAAGNAAAREFAKQQFQKLSSFAKDWLSQNPGATPKDFEDWAKRQEPAYTNQSQYLVNPATYIPAGAKGLDAQESKQNLVTKVKVNGVVISEDYRHPKIQQGLATGGVPTSTINFAKDLVLNKEQVVEAVEQYESTGTWPPMITSLASRSGRNAKAIVQAQTRLYGGSGVIMPPSSYQLPVSSLGVTYVDKTTAQNFAKANGFSQRGAIAYSTMIQDESGGNPLRIGDSGDASGLFQWNKRYSPDRVMRLQQFAKAQGKSPTDPAVQLQYSMYEMKTYYRDSWNIFKSSNPTTNQLFRATVQFLGFDESLDARRKASLEANLR
jgi:hypothetical protein